MNMNNPRHNIRKYEPARHRDQRQELADGSAASHADRTIWT